MSFPDIFGLCSKALSLVDNVKPWDSGCHINRPRCDCHMTSRFIRWLETLSIVDVLIPNNKLIRRSSFVNIKTLIFVVNNEHNEEDLCVQVRSQQLICGMSDFFLCCNTDLLMQTLSRSWRTSKMDANRFALGLVFRLVRWSMQHFPGTQKRLLFWTISERPWHCRHNVNTRIKNHFCSIVSKIWVAPETVGLASRGACLQTPWKEHSKGTIWDVYPIAHGLSIEIVNYFCGILSDLQTDLLHSSIHSPPSTKCLFTSWLMKTVYDTAF